MENQTMQSQSNSIAALAAALAKAQRQIQSAKKDSVNPHFRSRYADLASCWDACREQLTSNGIAVVQPIHNDGPYAFLKTILVHESGEWIASGSYPLKPMKDDPQGLGSAITYARRYSLCAMVGVAPDDDDGEAATGRTVQQTKTPTYQAPAQPQQAAPSNRPPEFEATQQQIVKQYGSGDTKRGPTEKQISFLHAMKSKAGWHDQELKQYLQAEFNVSSTKALNIQQFNKILDLLKNKTPFVEAFAGHEPAVSKTAIATETSKGGAYDPTLDEIPF